MSYAKNYAPNLKTTSEKQMTERLIYTDEPEEWKKLAEKYPHYTIIELSNFILGVIDED